LIQQIEYSRVLRQFLEEHREVDLMRAYELGKDLQNKQITPDALLAMHMEALDALPKNLTEEERLVEVMSSFNFLLEAMIAYGIAYSDAYQLLEKAASDAEEAKYELERLVADLDLANRQLLDVDRLKTRFFANMSHELRTPLNSIICCSEDLLDKLEGPLNLGQERYVQISVDAANHLLTVINEILDLAKLQSGTLSVQLADVSVCAVLREFRNTLEPLVLKKKQRLEVADGEGLPAVWGDHVKLMQVLLNLGSNAHKFTPAGGLISVRAQSDGQSVNIEVQDTGIGIPPGDMAHLFEEFRQVDAMRKDVQKGSGLGLAITKQLVELLGGRIYATSQVGVGSLFRFTLPCVKQSP
jgi:signal transduction histidine kinase